LEVFDASVNNPFPIPTGPNPVNFNVPGPTTVPTAVRPAVPPATPTLSASNLDLLTGETDEPTASTDPLIYGGSSLDPIVKASADSLVAPEPGFSSFVADSNLQQQANSLIVSFLKENGLNDKDSQLMLSAPSSVPLF
jgi:hypothetical protein